MPVRAHLATACLPLPPNLPVLSAARVCHWLHWPYSRADSLDMLPPTPWLVIAPVAYFLHAFLGWVTSPMRCLLSAPAAIGMGCWPTAAVPCSHRSGQAQVVKPLSTDVNPKSTPPQPLPCASTSEQAPLATHHGTPRIYAPKCLDRPCPSASIPPDLLCTPSAIWFATGFPLFFHRGSPWLAPFTRFLPPRVGPGASPCLKVVVGATRRPFPSLEPPLIRVTPPP
jgi:hypothetical protein